MLTDTAPSEMRSKMTPKGQVLVDMMMEAGWVSPTDAPDAIGWWMHIDVIDYIANSVNPERWTSQVAATCASFGKGCVSPQFFLVLPQRQS